MATDPINHLVPPFDLIKSQKSRPFKTYASFSNHLSKPLHFFGTFFRSLSQASGLYFVFLKAWQLYHQNKYRRRETRQNFKIKIQLARTSWNALAELSIKSSINSNSNWITAELALFLRSSCLPDFIYSLLCLIDQKIIAKSLLIW